MAEKKAKTAQKRGGEQSKKLCAKCGSRFRWFLRGLVPRGYFGRRRKECGESGCPYPARTK
jgi:hypothetical protein